MLLLAHSGLCTEKNARPLESAKRTELVCFALSNGAAAAKAGAARQLSFKPARAGQSGRNGHSTSYPASVSLLTLKYIYMMEVDAPCLEEGDDHAARRIPSLTPAPARPPWRPPLRTPDPMRQFERHDR